MKNGQLGIEDATSEKQGKLNEKSVKFRPLRIVALRLVGRQAAILI